MVKGEIVSYFYSLNYQLIETIYYYQKITNIYSLVFTNQKSTVIIDVNICRINNNKLFSYYDYVTIQNYYVKKSDFVYRFYIEDNLDFQKVILSLQLLLDNHEDYEIKAPRGVIHIDNTPTEQLFETLFTDVYGSDALSFLEKEYSLTTLKGNTLYCDYVLETTTSKYAIEENGVTYHHPQIIGKENYKLQLERQNSLIYYKFKVYRWSSEHVSFKNVMKENIQDFFGDKEKFINKFSITEDRKFELYEHQEDLLKTIDMKRNAGVKAFLIVIPTASGKSQIAIEDIKREYIKKHKLNVLIMSPSTQLKKDWEKRIKKLRSKISIQNLTYIGAYNLINCYNPLYFDYIIIDEAHHAVAPTCKKVIKYFNADFILGLTATPERMDKKKLEDVFGTYNSYISLEEAIKKNIISPIRVFRIQSNIDLSEVRYNGVDYRNSDIERIIRVDSRNELIAKVLKKYFSITEFHQKQGIVFCVNINHTKEMAKILKRYGIDAEAIYGGNSKNDIIIEKYRSKEIQFLCSCSMISEGWDEPSTEIVVMARPTLSKVLYLQQLGRGLRKYEGKEALYVIDVVDQYGELLKPWSVHSIFNINLYKPFSDVFDINYKTNEMVRIQGLVEDEIAIKEIDIETFEEKYKDYLSVEQTARQLFVSTGTVNSWIKKNDVRPAVKYKIHNSLIYMFAPEQIQNIRISKGLKERTNETIKEDFYEFINEKSYTFSFKLVFLLSFLKEMNLEGEADINKILNIYKHFYLSRIENNLPVDKPNCVYTKKTLNDEVYLKRSMLMNPFEKFERKRFIFFSKDLNKFAMNPLLYNKITKHDINKIKSIYLSHLEEYYQKYGGLLNIDYLK